MLRPILCLVVSGAFAAGVSLSASGAPGDPCTREGFAADPPGFQSCTTCHVDFAVGEGDGSVRFFGIPAVWQPNTSYPIRVRLEDPGQVMWGFRVTVVDATGADAGTMVPADAWSEPCLFNGRNYLRQTNPGTRLGVPHGPVDWDFDWTSPDAGSGTVEFYAVGLSADFSSSPSGDVTYATASSSAEAGAGPDVSLVLQPDDVRLTRGNDWAVRARVVNHSANTGSFFFVSRVRLPSGQLFPATGSLAPPASVTLAPGGQDDLTIFHSVPLTAPLMTATYEAWVGAPPATIVATDVVAIAIVQ